jgi:Zn-finger nucleic acid-binding protein
MTPPPSPPKPPAAGSLHCPNCGAIADEQAPQCPYCQARLATISCPSCFRRLFLGAKFCSHCGTRAARDPHAERLDGETTRLLCPRCQKRLAVVRLGEMSLLECEICSGVWVGAEAFERLCADREAQASVLHGDVLRGQRAAAPGAEREVRYRPCPACKKMMNRVNFAAASGVVLDVCRKDGTFFDRDELHRVVTFIRGGGLERARAKSIAALKEEQRRLLDVQRDTMRRQTAASADVRIDLGGGGAGGFAAGALFGLFVETLFER